MLDQNTDRMWYVIGAVLVGAAIILIANGTIPEIFASVAGSFNNVTDNASSEVSSIMMYDPTDMIIRDELIYGMWVEQDTGKLNNDVQWNSSNFAVTEYMPVKEGIKYVFHTDTKTSNKRTVYFDEDYKYIDGWLNDDGTQKLVFSQETVAPKGAKWVRISTNYRENHIGTGIRVEEWWFGAEEDYEGR